MSRKDEGRRERSRRGLCFAVLVVVACGVAGCWHPHESGDGTVDSGGISLVGGGWNNFQGMATTNYYGLFHGFRGTAYEQVKSRVGTAGTLTVFSAAITEAPPAGSWTFTLFKNGAAQAMECAISGTDTSCVDLSGCVELAAGDEIAVRVVPTGATANAGGPRWTGVFTAAASCGS